MHPSSYNSPPPTVWANSALVKECVSCSTSFGFFTSKHHCYQCGQLFCEACIPVRMPLPPRHHEAVPVCQPCYSSIMAARARMQPQMMMQQQQPMMMPQHPMMMMPQQQPMPMTMQQPHPQMMMPAMAAAPHPAAASSSAPSISSFQENLSVLRSLYKEIDTDVASAVLTAQRNNLARAIKFLRGEETAASAEEEEKNQRAQADAFPAQQAAVNAANAAAMQGATVAAIPGGAAAAPRVAANGAGMAMAMPPLPSLPPAVSLHALAPDQRLTLMQKQFFFAHGFLHLSNVVRQELVQRALGHINESLGRGVNVEDYHRGDKSSSLVKHCPDKWDHPAIAALFKQSPCGTLVESLLGVGGFNPPGQGQIALTFPHALRYPAAPAGSSASVITAALLENPALVSAAMSNWNSPDSLKRSWHIDGIHRKKNGFAADEIKNFTLLVGVYLSAAPLDFHGNITVFPGSHRELESYFRREDPIVRVVDENLPDIKLNPPHQLHVMPGDVLLSHYQTAHTVAPNFSPNIRYAVYFRCIHSSRPSLNYSAQCMTHIWTEYAGLRDLVEEERRREEQVQAAKQQVEQAERRRKQEQEQEAKDLARAMELSRIEAQQSQQPQQQQQSQSATAPVPAQRAAAPVASPVAVAQSPASIASPSHVQSPSSANLLSNPYAPAPR